MIDFIASQRASFVLALSDLYQGAELVKAGSRASNGRGGFTGSASSNNAISVHIETSHETLVARNISPDQALIYILNETDDVRPEKGDAIKFDGEDYMIIAINTDPVSVAYECTCDRG